MTTRCFDGVIVLVPLTAEETARLLLESVSLLLLSLARTGKSVNGDDGSSLRRFDTAKMSDESGGSGDEWLGLFLGDMPAAGDEAAAKSERSDILFVVVVVTK